MVITDVVINTLLGRVTRHPAGMPCPARDDAFVYRQDAAKRQTAGIRFTHWPKIRFFAPQGLLVAPIQVKLCRTDRHLGPLGRVKFHINRRRGWECGSQNIKNFHFLVKSRPADSLGRFRKF